MKPKKIRVPKPKKTLTSRQYVHRGADICPNCHSKAITAGRMEVDGDAWTEVECNDCGTTWQDVYKLVCYDNLDIPKGKKS